MVVRQRRYGGARGCLALATPSCVLCEDGRQRAGFWVCGGFAWCPRACKHPRPLVPPPYGSPPSGRGHDDDRLRRGGGEESRERRGESTSKQTSTARYMHEPGRVPTDSADSNSDSDTPVCCHVVSSPRSGVLKLNRVCCMREKRWQQIRGP